MNMPKRKSVLYRVIRYLVWLFYPRLTLEGLENLPPEPCILVGNHAQMNGPIAAQLYLPRKRRIWCEAEMMHLREVPAYAYRDFWSQKPRWSRPFYKLLSYLIAPLSVCVFNNADTIPVYRDRRVVLTFRETVEQFADGADIVIFPEHDKKRNNIVYDFQEHFVDVAKLCRKKTGREVAFVPMYIAPRLRTIRFGAPVTFDASRPLAVERERVCTCLMEEITSIARSMPPHTVVPYRNIRKRDYPRNTDYRPCEEHEP